MDLITVGTQMLANMMTANEEVLNIIWPYLFTKTDYLLQLLKIEHEKTCRVVLLLLYNCVYMSAERR